ncbi:MAG: LamG-like jellyroll fold domain-containing protein [Verrucomicrobiota bacterium]
MRPTAATPAERTPSAITLTGGTWNYLVSPDTHGHPDVSVTVQIETPATQFDFFGASWSAWPDPRFEDRGFEAGIALCESPDATAGYRVQLSLKHQQVALVRFPDGGYLASVACPLKPKVPVALRVRAAGGVVEVWVDGQPRLQQVDRLGSGLSNGHIALGVASAARVRFSDLTIRSSPTPPPATIAPHTPRFTARRWLGDRWFVFDGDEPVLQLHSAADPSQFAKLRPGLKPLLTFDSHWGVENQGAYKEAAATWTEPTIEGGGATLRAQWSARHVGGRYTTTSSLQVGYDPRRDAYTYDIASRLEVLPGEPFLFAYGFDFEHHTPLDPFRWKYLMIRDRAGQLTYRPVAPFDPGVLEDISAEAGLRVWHGRVGDPLPVAPAVEYSIDPAVLRVLDEQGKPAVRRLNTAVCAAFYDTGVAFERARAQPGDAIQVRYRYTGYPAAETEQLFATARVQDNLRIDPGHHFVFAGNQWPQIRFQNAVPMDQPWWGNRPFLSGHNARPRYDHLPDEGGILQLGPVSQAIAPVGPETVAPGRYRVTARVRSFHSHGPGGRIDLLSLRKADPVGNGFVGSDPGNILRTDSGYLPTGTYGWREFTFLAEVPKSAAGLALSLGNEGTGRVWVSSVTIEPWNGRPDPADTLPSRPTLPAPAYEALWDLRMTEQTGLHVFNRGRSSYRTLELANVDWVVDGGRPALRFAENPVGRADFPKLGILDQWLRNPRQRLNYAPVSHGAYGLGGYHGGGDRLPGLTLAAWIQPAARMGKGQHEGRGDVIGYGARRFVLGLGRQDAPYPLEARLNSNDRIESSGTLPAGRWSHVALTAHPEGGQWRVTLFLDGEPVGSGVSRSLPADTEIPDSVVLGAEFFYLHDAYFRGLMGSVLVVPRALAAAEMKTLARLTGE